MDVNEFIEYLITLQKQGKGCYKIHNGEYGYALSIDSETSNVEVRDDNKELIIW
jgi:mRNA-degrading endonuclease RelE of RelBE toxin-antitoxin system